MMTLKNKRLLDEIAEKKDLPDALQQQLHAAAKEFVAAFKVS
jgi:hypothetical protein